MNAAQFSHALGKVNDKYIMEAITYERKKKSGWLKWGALAACFCLILTAAMVTLPGILDGANKIEPPSNSNIPGGGNVPGEQQGGIFTDGVDPIIESIAVYPATEDIRDVEDATMEDVDEVTAYGISGLGDYLPTKLPADYQFDKADLYETTMRNGSQYHMLRVTYAAGGNDTLAASANDDDGELAPAPNTFSSSFSIFVMDFEPKTKKTIYRFEDLPKFLETAKDVAVFHFSYGNVFIGFSPSELSTEEILTVINSIPPMPNKGSAPAEHPDTTIVPGFGLDEPAESAEP